MKYVIGFMLAIMLASVTDIWEFLVEYKWVIILIALHILIAMVYFGDKLYSAMMDEVKKAANEMEKAAKKQGGFFLSRQTKKL